MSANFDWSLSQRNSYAFHTDKGVVGHLGGGFWEELTERAKASDFKRGEGRLKIITLKDLTPSKGDRVFKIGKRGVSTRFVVDSKVQFVREGGYLSDWSMFPCGRNSHLTVKDILRHENPDEWAVIPLAENVRSGFSVFSDEMLGKDEKDLKEGEIRMSEKASKFKVGDVVRVVKVSADVQEKYIGLVGVLKTSDSWSYPHHVVFESGDSFRFKDENLKLVDMEKESILTAVNFLIEQGSKEDLREWLLGYLRESAVEIMDELGDYDRAIQFLKLEEAVRQ